MKNQINFKLRARYALFTDPVTKIGGEKCSYHIPTYEALKGAVSSIYWKPTFTWIIDEVRIINPIQTEAKNIKPLDYSGGNTLAIYTYLSNVEYHVKAHFEWNLQREDLTCDRIDGKHFDIATRMVTKGGFRDIFLGARECQGYVEPITIEDTKGHYDTTPELSFGLMFHGFDYPDTTGEQSLYSRFWRPTMKNGVIHFIRPEECTIRKYVRPMRATPPLSSELFEKEKIS
jgi:CRISPR-associated protein Cas5d